MGAISHFLRTTKNDFYHEHAKRYVGDTELKRSEILKPNPTNYKAEFLRKDTKDHDINIEFDTGDNRSGSGGPRIGLGEKLKRIGLVAGIGGAALGLAGLAAYGAYRLKKERDKEKIEIGSSQSKREVE